MLLTDFWMLDGFMASYPPADILVAAYLGYKSPAARKGKVATSDAAKMNAKALSEMPARKRVKTLDQMPAFLRTPGKLKMIEEAKAAWRS